MTKASRPPTTNRFAKVPKPLSAKTLSTSAAPGRARALHSGSPGLKDRAGHETIQDAIPGLPAMFNNLGVLSLRGVMTGWALK